MEETRLTNIVLLKERTFALLATVSSNQGSRYTSESIAIRIANST